MCPGWFTQRYTQQDTVTVSVCWDILHIVLLLSCATDQHSCYSTCHTWCFQYFLHYLRHWKCVWSMSGNNFCEILAHGVIFKTWVWLHSPCRWPSTLLNVLLLCAAFQTTSEVLWILFDPCPTAASLWVLLFCSYLSPFLVLSLLSRLLPGVFILSIRRLMPTHSHTMDHGWFIALKTFKK